MKKGIAVMTSLLLAVSLLVIFVVGPTVTGPGYSGGVGTVLAADPTATPVPVTSGVSRPKTVLTSVQVIPGFGQSVKSDGTVVLDIKISRIVNPATSVDVLASGGIGGYDFSLTYTGGSSGNVVNMQYAGGIAPFSSPTYNVLNATGSTSVNATQVGSAPQAPLTVAQVAPRLMGSSAVTQNIVLSFNSVVDAANGDTIPQDGPKTFVAQRGDARKDGTVNITDALFIAQSLAGLRGYGDTTELTHVVNGASVKLEDTTTGEKLNIADALLLAQMLAGLRDASFNTLAGPTLTGLAPGATVSLVAPAPQDGSTVQSYQWTQASGPTATITGGTTANPTVTLANLEAYKAFLVAVDEPSAGWINNPTAARALDRWIVQAINPYALEKAEKASFKVTVTTTKGTYSNTFDTTVDLPLAISSGLANVPVNLPVLLHGKSQASYNWSLTTSPSGSAAVVDSATSRYPAFKPDLAGKYTATEAVSGKAIDVYAGTWAGAITGQGTDGKPLAAACTVCHNGTVAPDKFTAWRESGHANKFSDDVKTTTYTSYLTSCTGCHTVGYNKGTPAIGTAVNSGFDEASDLAALAAAGIIGKPAADNWTRILAGYPNTARMAGIQCENCHGPSNGGGLHMNGAIDPGRVSLSADVCAQCHGEPLRHGRFQQWERSKHNNPALALSRSTSGHCARCHTGQGFVAWLKQGDLTKYIQGASGNATSTELQALGLTEDRVQSQTCATCHEPHNPGTTSSLANDVKLRVDGSTAMLPSGFKAENVGRGALCITCHNSRNGLRNDTVGLPTSYSAPHMSAQGDVFMGENAYFVTTGATARSKHSFIENTCTKCHMVLSKPPADLSYNQGGTNHTFVPDPKVCSNCHGAAFGASSPMAASPKDVARPLTETENQVQLFVETKSHELGSKMGAYLLAKLGDTFMIKDYTPHTYNNKSYDVLSSATTINKSNVASMEPTEPHGQQGFIIKFVAPVSFTYTPTGESSHQVSLTEAEVRLGDITSNGTTVVIPTTDPLVRAGWNYFLVHGDASKGVHNPSYVLNVLQGAINAVANPASVSSIAAGGRIFDKWWTAVGATAPTTDNPLWSLQTTNTRTGGDTWRCKECHGWDYRGKDGAYATGSHRTGFVGVYDAAQWKSKTELTDIMKGSSNAKHDFRSVLSAAALSDLVNFLKEGILDDTKYIDYATKAPINANATRGQQLYSGVCAACHGADGRAINFGTDTQPEYIGTVAGGNPWEFLHKVMFGQPGTVMPAGVTSGWIAQDAVDVLGYARTLPTVAPTPTPVPTTTPTPAPTATPTPTAAPTASPTPVVTPTPTPAPTASPTPTPAPTASPSPSPSPTPTIDSAAAQTIYTSTCAGCHGANRGGGFGPALTSTALASKTETQVITTITNGQGSMPAYGSSLTSAQITNLAQWLKATP